MDTQRGAACRKEDWVEMGFGGRKGWHGRINYAIRGQLHQTLRARRADNEMKEQRTKQNKEQRRKTKNKEEKQRRKQNKETKTKVLILEKKSFFS